MNTQSLGNGQSVVVESMSRLPCSPCLSPLFPVRAGRKTMAAHFASQLACPDHCRDAGADCPE